MAVMSRRPDWDRLGRAVKERREALRISQGAAGISASTWRKVEHAVEPPYRRATLLTIAAALGWTPDSIDRLLDGKDPLELDGTRHGPAPSNRSVEERLDQLEAEIVSLRDRLRRAANGPSA
jgi:hypothetical protein